MQDVILLLYLSFVISCLQMTSYCIIVLIDSGGVPDLARLMIRDCRYDVSSVDI